MSNFFQRDPIYIASPLFFILTLITTSFVFENLGSNTSNKGPSKSKIVSSICIIF